MLLEPGALVAAQSPAYLGALDDGGLRAPRYRPMRLGAGFGPGGGAGGRAIAYTVPNFSNPSGGWCRWRSDRRWSMPRTAPDMADRGRPLRRPLL